jgi:hypothetical protein
MLMKILLYLFKYAIIYIWIYFQYLNAIDSETILEEPASYSKYEASPFRIVATPGHTTHH